MKKPEFNPRNLIYAVIAFIVLAIALILPLGVNFNVNMDKTEAQAQSTRPLPNGGEYLPKNLFVELGRRVNPAVVNISTTQVVQGPGRGFGPPGMPPGLPYDPFQQFFEDFMGGPMRMPEQRAQSLGSGFVIEADGLIITNNHVVENASDIQVQLVEKSKDMFKAKVVGADKRTDIALIRITANTKLPVVTLGDSDKIEVGEWVAAFGNPFGHGHSMTKGIISAKEREIDVPEASYFPFLQTDASINPGNSGGPLVNVAGEVIGVNTAIDARAQGIGFAIPINAVKKLLPELKSKGRVTRGFLGVGINDIDERMVKQFRLKNSQGALIINVTPGSPAEKAGIQPYDIVTEFDGKPIEDARSLMVSVAETKVGDSVKVKVLREGRSVDLSVKVVERRGEVTAMSPRSRRPLPPGGIDTPFNLGLGLADLTPELARELRMPEAPKRAVVVVSLRPGGLAEQAGIQIGDLILDINKKPVRSARDATKAFTKGPNSLRILRGQQTILVFMDAS